MSDEYRRVVRHLRQDAEGKLPVTEEWLRERGFLPDGDDPGNREFGWKVWGAGETTDWGEHPAMHVLVSLIDLSVWLESYDTGGKTQCLIELPYRATVANVERLLAALGEG